MSVERIANGLAPEFVKIGKGSSDDERLISGLYEMNVLREPEQFIGYSDGEPWHKGGSETFIADCKVIYGIGLANTSVRRVIAKALVSFASSSDQRLKDWQRRRAILRDLGVSVPELFWVGNGMLLEEFIDDGLSLEELSPAVIEQIAEVGAILDRSGFLTLNFLGDLRLKEEKVFYVDFGFDLGEQVRGRVSSNARQVIDRRLTEPFRSSCLNCYDKSFPQR